MLIRNIAIYTIKSAYLNTVLLVLRFDRIESINWQILLQKFLLANTFYIVGNNTTNGSPFFIQLVFFFYRYR